MVFKFGFSEKLIKKIENERKERGKNLIINRFINFNFGFQNESHFILLDESTEISFRSARVSFSFGKL